MDDTRVWDFENSLWTGDAEHYRTLIDDDILMVLPEDPPVLGGTEAIEAVIDTPRWTEVTFTAGRIARPQEGLIVVAYTAHARRDEGNDYIAHCTSTYRRLGPDEWRVVQHQQTPELKVAAA